MKFRYPLVFLAFGLVLAALIAPAATPKPEVGAQLAAEKWLVLVDNGKYDDSWSQLARSFKGMVKKKNWSSIIAEIRQPLGKVVSRTLKSAEFTKELPGAPEGEYVLLKFDTVFQNRSNVVETVTPMLEGDLIWRVSGYSVK